MIEPGTIESADAFAAEEISIRDQRGDHAVRSNPTNDLVEVRVKQRLAPAEGDDAGPQHRQSIDAAHHVVGRHGRGVIVVFVAVRARQIAPPDRNEVRGDGPVRELQGSGQHSRFAKPFGHPANTAPQSNHGQS